MYDLAVIGGGPGGYVAAIRAAQKGLKVLLIEKDCLGGTCLNRGCISTKCFFHDTKVLRRAKTSQVITGAKNLSIDMKKMVARKRQVVESLLTGLKKIITSYNIELVQGLGELITSGRVKVIKDDRLDTGYQAKHIILATGSKPDVPKFIEADGYHIQTTDEVLDSEDLPHSLIIIGGGVIGVEMANIYQSLGCQVTILELLPEILMTEDEEIRRVMKMLMLQRGVKIYLKANVKELIVKSPKINVIFDDENRQTNTLKVDRVLVATGRVPVFEGIDVGKLGIEMAGPFIKVNTRLETSLPGIFAIGDLIGGVMLAQKASAEAEVAVANILGGKKEVKPELIPRCIWGFTEIASVGFTEEDARRLGRQIRVGKFSYMNSGAGQVIGDKDGFVKVVGDAESGEILGVHILGERATDLISESVFAMTIEAVVEDLAKSIKPHPTLSEAVMEAAMGWNDLAIHLLNKPR